MKMLVVASALLAACSQHVTGPGPVTDNSGTLRPPAILAVLVVVDAEPFAGATVQAPGLTPQEKTTIAPHGVSDWTSVPRDLREVTVTVSAAGYRTETRSVALDPGHASMITVALTRSSR
jgi:hypothetical protein